MRRYGWIVATVTLFVGGSLSAAVPLPTGHASPSLQVHVVDTSGASIPSVEVTVYHDRNKLVQLRTDHEGYASFLGIAGDYEVDIVGCAWAPVWKKLVKLAEGEATTITLQPANVTNNVGVGAPCGGRSDDAALALRITEVHSQNLVAAVPAADFPVADVSSHANWNFGALIQGGFGLTEDRGGFKFFLIGGHAGRILTSNLGSGLLKGNFEYGVEVFPLWQSYTPKFQKANCHQIAAPPQGEPGTYVSCSAQYTVGGTYTGVSITPAIFRWNFTHGERWMPWIQGAGGVIWTNHKYPAFGVPLPAPGPITIGPPLGDYYLTNDGPSANTSVWNFTPQFGVGTHYFVRPRRSIDVSANAVHISSASLGDKNPGVNVSVQFSVGYSWWK